MTRALRNFAGTLAVAAFWGLVMLLATAGGSP